ncbi:exported protein of unknown function [Azospirillum baldaniorum]|uniref:Secreted protein n=1 Tax=Azospirillum baldaniorum TaxID=1064539 RepID=A0A9P1JN84_9PROT|nr:exported protein of unknown function [Azospirillum baldaniorum]
MASATALFLCPSSLPFAFFAVRAAPFPCAFTFRFAVRHGVFWCVKFVHHAQNLDKKCAIFTAYGKNH